MMATALFLPLPKLCKFVGDCDEQIWKHESEETTIKKMYPNFPLSAATFFSASLPLQRGANNLFLFLCCCSIIQGLFPPLYLFFLTSSIPHLSPPTAYLQMLLVPSSPSSSSFHGMHCERLFGWWGRKAQGSRGGIGSVVVCLCCLSKV